MSSYAHVVQHIPTFCFVAAPLFVFAVKPTSVPLVKVARLLIPIFVFFIASTALVGWDDCVRSVDHGCWFYKGFFLSVSNALFIMYLGWFEYAWRRYYGQYSWPVRENLKYGTVSNIVLVVSAIMTLVFITVSVLNLIIFPVVRG